MESNKGVLYLIPSPIGNIKELSPRSISILNEIDLIFCEDTRVTNKLLSILNINKKTISAHEHNEKEMSSLLLKYLNEGKNIAYMSDAGYPCISDPGNILVNKCIKNKIRVIPLNGPTASLPSIIASGLDSSHFLFYGFLKSKESERISELKTLKEFPYTIILYEAPHRILVTLKNTKEIFGNRKIVIAREISKIHEEFIYTSLDNVLNENITLKGEFVIVVEGNLIDKKNNDELIDKSKIEALISSLEKYDLNKKDIIEILNITTNINKNELKKLIYKN